jgi:hypothetical protein
MAIVLPDNWTTFSGGDGAVCELSAPSISSSGDMDCLGGASVTLSVTGGVGPYSWVTTKGVLDSATGTTVHLTPPANTYSGISGTNAFAITTKAIGTFCFCKTSVWDCYGTKWQTCLGINNDCWLDCGGQCTCNNCTTAADAVCDTSCSPSCDCGKSQCADSFGCPEVNAHCFCTSGDGDPTCLPCAISMNGGAVVTVTDSLGQSSFVAVETSPRTTI